MDQSRVLNTLAITESYRTHATMSEAVFDNLLKKEAQESIHSLAESIPGLFKRLQIRALVDLG